MEEEAGEPTRRFLFSIYLPLLLQFPIWFIVEQRTFHLQLRAWSSFLRHLPFLLAEARTPADD